MSDHRPIYLLPNLLTTAGLFAGFYAIVAAMKGNFEVAAVAIFVAMIMDGLDGRVARLTGTESEFGAQYDSLSDMMCFGVTPALVVYSWGLRYLGKFGWLAAFFYVAATALRLARFNIQVGYVDKKYFIGIPCPAAAAVIAGMVWVGTDFGIPGKHISEIVALVTIITAALMVSNVRYPSFKELDFKEHVPFVAVLLVLVTYLLIAWDPPKVLFGIFSVYALSGLVLWLRTHLVNKVKL
ncbi:MAG TPA: CDP-diacylglycerol--serine O-phosphatidyltransferase [Gammaproteobacteria bacterium]|nr:CDP-diacylglycerol--serine O-phosphatidyltransferase [Gammaproteobacteria bacterium]